jgi:transketolase
MPTLDRSKYAPAPLKELQKKFGFTADRVIEAAKEQLAIAKQKR